MDAQAAARPEAIAVIEGADQLTYAHIAQASANLADRLRARGLGPGDRAVVQLPNCAEFVIVFHALLRAGIAPVNAIFTHRQLEMTSYVDQLRPALLIGDASHELFADARFLIALEAGGIRPDLVILRGGAQTGGLDDWLRPTGRPAQPPTPTAADEVAFFQLSGGSTGTPKLIPRTHNDYDYSIRASAEICGLTPETRFLCALPAAHNFTLSSPGILGVFHAGGTVVMAPGPEPVAGFDLIARHRIDLAALVPSAVQLWLSHAEVHGAPRPLRRLLVGGASFAPALAARVPEVLRADLQQVFGMAEGLVNYTRPGDEAETTFTTQGRPISPDDEIRVLDPEDGRPVPDGQPGALAVRGPYTCRGYYQSPGHNAQAFDAEGFYHSGDLVVRRADGYLRVVGRIKDQINRGGEKIAAEEIEALLLRHPAIRQAALIARPDAAMGERSVAVIVSTEAVKPSALRRHLSAAGLARYKLPDQFRRLDSLPLTPIGKTDKRRLRALLEEQDHEEGALT
nr:AMP-binding protein [Paracoccus sp. S1E-3]